MKDKRLLAHNLAEYARVCKEERKQRWIEGVKRGHDPRNDDDCSDVVNLRMADAILGGLGAEMAKEVGK